MTGSALTRRQFLQASLSAAAAAGLGTGWYTWQLEPHWLEVVSRPLPIRGLSAALEGARLVQLSDLHMGRRVSEEFLLDAFRRIAALQPDVVVVTGDLTSHHAGVLEQAKRVYARMPRGRLATVCVLGNHDYGDGWSDEEAAGSLADVLAESGVKVLRNEVADVSGLQIVGMDDLWARRFLPLDALAKVDVRRPMLALSHNPDSVDLPGWDGFEGWILAGHTHGGQCKPPFLPPPLLPVQNKRYTAGTFDLPGRRHLYINRGLGHVMQVRFNVRPEVTLFELQGRAIEGIDGRESIAP